MGDVAGHHLVLGGVVVGFSAEAELGREDVDHLADKIERHFAIVGLLGVEEGLGLLKSVPVIYSFNCCMDSLEKDVSFYDE